MLSYSFERAQEFVWKNARLLDRRIFALLYAGGTQREVITALKAYQNPDGGFGQALEPDKRCPDSQPVDVEFACNVLDLIGALGDPLVHAEILLPACDFLTSITTPEGGVPFALPSVTKYPRAPWWQADDNPPASLNPTAAIVGRLLQAGVNHPWVERACAYCWQAIEASETEDYHTLMPVIGFLENVPDRARAQRAQERILETIRKSNAVEYDPQAGGYVKMPLDWAPRPTSFCRQLFNEATIARHLEALAARQHSDGGWPISWDPISPAVELEWRGWVTINALRTLEEYQHAGITA